jgi:hypothetical protein
MAVAVVMTVVMTVMVMHLRLVMVRHDKLGDVRTFHFRENGFP